MSIVPKKIQKPKYNGINPNIIRAAKLNNLAEAEASIERNYECVNEQERNTCFTALHISSLRGNFGMVAFLLEHDHIDLTLCDYWGRDVLDVAILAGDQRIIDALFRYQAATTDGLHIE